MAGNGVRTAQAGKRPFIHTMSMRRILPFLALLLAVPSSSVVVGRNVKPVPAAVPVAAPGVHAVPSGTAVLSPSQLSPSAPSLAPSLSPSLSAPSIPSHAAAFKAAVSAPASAPSPLLPASFVAARAAPSAVPVLGDPAAGSALSAAALSAPSDAPGDARFEKAAALVARETADWKTLTAPAGAPAPRMDAPAPRRGSGLAKAAKWTGVAALGLSAVAALPAALPVAVPVALTAAKGWLAWGGFAALGASSFLKPAAEPGAAIPAASAPRTGRFAEYRTAWARVGDALDAQKAIERRVGDGDRSAFSLWLRGGLRAGLFTAAAALMFMLGGGAAAKLLSLGAATAKAAPAAIDVSIATAPFLTQLANFVAPALLLETVLLKVVFDGSRALLGRVATPRAATLGAGALAVLGAVAAMSFLSTNLSVLLPLAAIEAAVVWSYARSGSLLGALAARGLITLLSLEAARATAWISGGTAGVLLGLPAWSGLAVATLLVAGALLAGRKLGWRAALGRPAAALGDIAASWGRPAADGAPRPFLPVLRAGLFWGLATFATGDLVYRVIHFFAPVAESAPEVLAKVLTGPLDVVLFNFVLVGFLEELVFRRNLFRPMRQWLEKRGLSPRAVFWSAALASSLIFSYVHYIDFGALLASWGIGGTVPGGGGAYVWSWATFSARAAAGALLAWQYWRSGLLLVPVIAHFASNTLEGLGYRWGVETFLLMAAATVLLALTGRASASATPPASPPARA